MFKKIKKIFYKSFYRSIDDKEISYKNLIQNMKDENMILVDVRSNQEYEEGHLDGAINIPIFNLKQEIENKINDKDALIVVYCSSGYRSIKAKNILERLGYTNIYNLKDGINNIWIQ